MSTLNDDDLLKKINEEADSLKIPEGIKPENMMKRIKEMKTESHFEEEKVTNINKGKKKKNSARLSFWVGGFTTAAVAAATAITLLVSGVYKDTAINTEFPSVSVPDINNQGTIHNNTDEKIKTLSHYTEVYQYICDMKNSSDDFGYGGGITNDMVEEGMLETDTEVSKPTDEQSKDYSETNVRTENVDESDVVKTDGKYIYYLSPQRGTVDIDYEESLYYYDCCYYSYDYTLKIAKADGENSELVCQYELKGDADMPISDCEMFINDNTLVVIANGYVDSENGVKILFYDISDKKNVTLKDTLWVSGSLNSSRMTGGYLYLFTEKYLNYNYIWDSEESDKTIDELVAPKANGETLRPEDVYMPDCKGYDQYSIITTVDMKDTSKFYCEKAILGNRSGSIYMSGKKIYYASQINENYMDYYNTDQLVEGQEIEVVGKSEILALNYKDGMVNSEAKAIIEGSVGDEFDIDEYNGYLRMAVSVGKNRVTVRRIQPNSDIWWKINDDFYVDNWESEQYSSLYIFDDKLNLVSQIPHLQDDESVYGVRFDGDMAYIVTYRQTDPLFTVDLSNPVNPVVIGALKIPGFSTYLHKWDDNTLVGIGYNEDGYIKVSTFDISDKTDVKEADICTLEEVYWSNALYNHKAIFVAPEKNLLGFAAPMSNGLAEYKVFSYVNGELTVVISQSLPEKEFQWYNARSFYIGEYIYIVSGNDAVYVYDMNTMEKVCTVE